MGRATFFWEESMLMKKARQLALLGVATLPVVTMLCAARSVRADTFLFAGGSSWDAEDAWYDSSNLIFYNFPANDGSSVAVIGNGNYDIAGVSNSTVTFNS